MSNPVDKTLSYHPGGGRLYVEKETSGLSHWFRPTEFVPATERDFRRAANAAGLVVLSRDTFINKDGMLVNPGED